MSFGPVDSASRIRISEVYHRYYLEIVLDALGVPGCPLSLEMCWYATEMVKDPLEGQGVQMGKGKFVSPARKASKVWHALLEVWAEQGW